MAFAILVSPWGTKDTRQVGSFTKKLYIRKFLPKNLSLTQHPRCLRRVNAENFINITFKTVWCKKDKSGVLIAGIW